MKKLIPLLVLLGGTSAAFAQGTVLFDNGVLVGRPEVSSAYVFDIGGTTRLANAPGADTLRVQLLYGTTAGSLTAHTALGRFRPSGSTTAGTWRGLDASDTLNRSLPIGGVNVPIFLQVRAWDATAAGLTYDQATRRGESAVFTYTQTLGSPPATSDTFMLNFEGFSLVPEPSVIGLGIIGVGALFMLRRRK